MPIEVGRHDGFHESTRLGQHLGCRRVERTIEAQHRAKCAERVAIERGPRGRGQLAGRRRSTGIVVLDDHGGRLGQRTGDRQRAVQVEKIVVRKLLARQLLGRHQAGPLAGVARFPLRVERRVLMRILSVPQNFSAAQIDVPAMRKQLGLNLAGQVFGDYLVVTSRTCKRRLGQLAAQLERGRAVRFDL